MKQFKLLFVVFLGILIFSIVSSCTKNLNEEYLKVSDFNNVGLLHNEFLTASDIAFPQGLDPADPNYIQIANQFNQNLILDQTVLNKYGIAVNDAIGFQNALSF
jgi:hypothetical protein